MDKRCRLDSTDDNYFVEANCKWIALLLLLLSNNKLFVILFVCLLARFVSCYYCRCRWENERIYLATKPATCCTNTNGACQHLAVLAFCRLNRHAPYANTKHNNKAACASIPRPSNRLYCYLKTKLNWKHKDDTQTEKKQNVPPTNNSKPDSRNLYLFTTPIRHQIRKQSAVKKYSPTLYTSPILRATIHAIAREKPPFSKNHTTPYPCGLLACNIQFKIK